MNMKPAPAPTPMSTRTFVLLMLIPGSLLVILAIVVAILLLGDRPVPAASNPPKVDRTSEPVEDQTSGFTMEQREDRFVTMVQEDISWAAGMTDADLIGMGRKICDVMVESEGDVAMVIIRMSQGITDPDEAATVGPLVGFSVGAFCPEYGDNLRNSN